MLLALAQTVPLAPALTIGAGVYVMMRVLVAGTAFPAQDLKGAIAYADERETFGERPDLPHPVLGGHQLIQAHRPQHDLSPLRCPQPRPTTDLPRHRRRSL